MDNVKAMENVDLKSMLKMNSFGKCKSMGTVDLKAMWKMNSFGKCNFNGKCRFKSHVENEFVWKM